MASCCSEDSQTHQSPSGISEEVAEEYGVDPVLRDAWDASIISQPKLATLRSSGAIFQDLVLRAPSERWPAPAEGEAVVFVDHLRCGLGLPFSPFFRSVLEFYRIEPANLPPNSILNS